MATKRFTQNQEKKQAIAAPVQSAEQAVVEELGEDGLTPKQRADFFYKELKSL